MIAIIETSGKQYLVEKNDKIKVNKIKNSEVGGIAVFDKILLLSDNDSLKIGKPYIDGAKVEGKILREFKKKTTLMKFKSKTRQKTKKGYKNYFNEILIQKIE